jgi:hypothetical protein
MLPLDLSKKLKYKHFLSDHIPIHVVALNANFGQFFKVDVNCVIVDLVEIKAKFKEQQKMK